MLSTHVHIGATIDRQEIQSLYQERYEFIYRYVHSKIGNREDAEDLTAEIFLKAVRSLDQERNRESMHQWLYRVMRTTIADYWRAHYRRPLDSCDGFEDGRFRSKC
jgi:RNA polymerase sigma-70 factor, ECF subfamily